MVGFDLLSQIRNWSGARGEKMETEQKTWEMSKKKKKKSNYISMACIVN